MKNGSMPRVRAGRSITRPNTPDLPAVSARAALLGWKPISSAIARIRSLVAAEIPGLPFSAKETAAFVTPARWAMSVMVGRFIRDLPSAAQVIPVKHNWMRPGRVPVSPGKIPGKSRDASRTTVPTMDSLLR